jgi:hypothetical protein
LCGHPASYAGRLKPFADCYRNAPVLVSVTDENIMIHKLRIHLEKIMNNTESTAAHAAPRKTKGRACLNGCPA